LIYVAAAVVIAVAVILAFVFVRKGEGGAETPTTAMPSAPTQPPTPSPFGGGETTVIQGGGGTKQYYAGFEMPNGQIVPITDINKEFGREDFKSFLPPDVQTLVSRRHFKVSFSPRDKTFMIEDLGSANGTVVNSTEIRGKGRVPLKNDDVVSLGGVVNLKFKG
jgi:FHA domain